jgi:hypothetical protein
MAWKFNNFLIIYIYVLYGSAFVLLWGWTSNGMKIPHLYASVSVEEICQPRFEDMELEIPRGDR